MWLTNHSRTPELRPNTAMGKRSRADSARMQNLTGFIRKRAKKFRDDKENQVSKINHFQVPYLILFGSHPFQQCCPCQTSHQVPCNECQRHLTRLPSQHGQNMLRCRSVMILWAIEDPTARKHTMTLSRALPPPIQIQTNQHRCVRS
jgi:hypothetical protein